MVASNLTKIIILGLVVSLTAQDAVISGYGPVSIEDLHPLTLSWNQVHYMVRDSLLEIEELAEIHDEFYKELHDCFGLEKCMKQANLLDGPPQSGREMGAGALLQSLRRQRLEELAGQHSRIAGDVRQVEQQLRQRQLELQRRQEEQQRQLELQRQQEQQRQQQQQRGQQQRGQSQGQQQQKKQQQQQQSSSSSFRHSRTGSGTGSGSSSSSSTSWSSSTTYERKVEGSAPGGGGSYTFNKQQTSSRGRIPQAEYDDYEDGPTPNRG